MGTRVLTIKHGPQDPSLLQHYDDLGGSSSKGVREVDGRGILHCGDESIGWPGWDGLDFTALRLLLSDLNGTMPNGGLRCG